MKTKEMLLPKEINDGEIIAKRTFTESDLVSLLIERFNHMLRYVDSLNVKVDSMLGIIKSLEEKYTELNPERTDSFR